MQDQVSFSQRLDWDRPHPLLHPGSSANTAWFPLGLVVLARQPVVGCLVGPVKRQAPHSLRNPCPSCLLFAAVTDLVAGAECFWPGRLIPPLRRREICLQRVESVVRLVVLIHLSLALTSPSHGESRHWTLESLSLSQESGC